jgi:hypothetical protein
LDLGGEPLRFLLNAHRRQAGANSMVLQRDWCAEHRHDAVAGELAQRSAVALHHGRGTVEQFGHDLAQPLRSHRRGDVLVVKLVRDIRRAHFERKRCSPKVALIPWKSL